MGSITKVMTAYVVLTTPGVNLNRVITVPSGIVGYDEEYDASTAGLRPGEKLHRAAAAVRDDAAVRLRRRLHAGHRLRAGRCSGFIAKMNATARKLGLTKTHFTDFSGLPDPGEYTTYSTAHDLVSLGRDAMRQQDVRVDRGDAHLPGGRPTSAHRAHVWANLNPLLGQVPGAIGIKTGFTAAAGQCLLFEATRGSKTLIGVVLDSSAVNSPAWPPRPPTRRPC